MQRGRGFLHQIDAKTPVPLAAPLAAVDKFIYFSYNYLEIIIYKLKINDLEIKLGVYMSKKSLKLLVVMLRTAQTVEDLVKKDMKGYGINPTEFAVLELLYNKGEQPIQKIGKKILLASSSITYVIDQLEKKGFVERLDCPDDRRIKLASITDKGKEFMNQAFPKHEKSIEEIFSNMTEEEIDTAIEVFKKIGLQG